MPTTRKRGAAVAVVTLGVLLSGALSGCSITRDDDQPDQKTAATPRPTPSETPSPTATTPSATESATSTPSATTSTTTAPTPQAALLAGADLPPLNSTSPWTDGRTDVPGPASFGVCQQYDVLSIGAMNVVQRDYRGAAGDTAGQQVAEFPDAQNTVRAGKVLEAWHDKCRGNVRGKHVRVGPITDVVVPQGKGWWYLVSYTRGGTGHFESFGVVFNGTRMTLLTMDHAGQDHNYEHGQDPMELAVKAASSKMG